MDDNCIFCKLANGVFQTNVVYEDENFTAFLDASPAAKGHTLIVPKAHVANVFELTDDLGEKIYPVVKKVAARQKEILGCDGVNVLQNNGPAAGQTVFHFHIHVIPRFDGDGVMKDWDHLELSDDKQKEICNKLKF